MNAQDLQKLASIVGQAIDAAEFVFDIEVHLNLDVARMVSEALDELANSTEPQTVRAELLATLDQNSPYRPAAGDLLVFQYDPGMRADEVEAIGERLRGVFEPATVVLIDHRVAVVGVTVVDPAELAEFLREAS